MELLTNLKISPEKVISDKSLVTLRGGDMPVDECIHVTCFGSTGEWYGVYETAGDLQAAIGTYCASGEATIETAQGFDCVGL